MIFGIANYDLILGCLKRIISDNIPFRDIRAFHALFDHKVILLNALDFLKTNSLIIDTKHMYSRLNNIKEICLANRNLFSKYLLTTDTSIILRIIKNIEIIKCEEMTIILDLLNELCIT